MRVAMMMDNPAGSQELYAALRAELRFEGPLGGAVHIAGPSPNGGWRVIEIFESPEAASRFLTERFAPRSQPSATPASRPSRNSGQSTPA